MFNVHKTYWARLTCLVFIGFFSSQSLAWSTDGSSPWMNGLVQNASDPMSQCDDWSQGTLHYFLGTEHPSHCGLRGRISVGDGLHSVSIGAPTRGALVYPEALLPNQYLTSRSHKRFGTRELVRTIERAVAVVNARFSDTPVLHVGDLSRKNGGHFPPHLSHQSGCDVDIGYYLKTGHRPDVFRHTNRRTIDVARTWTMIRSFLETGRAQYIFSDRRLIPMLRDYAVEQGEISEVNLRKWFGNGGIVRHLKGHADHLHIRIFAPESVAAVAKLEQEIGRTALRRLMTPVPIYTRIRSGDSLGRIARRARVSQSKLRRYNRLRGKSPRIYAGKRLIVGYRYPQYRVPKKITRSGRIAKRKASKPPKIAKANSNHSLARATARPKAKLRKRKRRKSTRRRRHTVKAGDNLSKLAHRYRVPTAELCRTNRLMKNCEWSYIRRHPVHLKIGQRLTIPRR
jgi:murein endopeptidase/LysM repeat protein